MNTERNYLHPAWQSKQSTSTSAFSLPSAETWTLFSNVTRPHVPGWKFSWFIRAARHLGPPHYALVVDA